jgi:hypothetical protein
LLSQRGQGVQGVRGMQRGWHAKTSGQGSAGPVLVQRGAA